MPVDGFHTITLGCKLNQFDSAALEGELARRGLRPQSDPSRAAVVIVNTCTVTHRADADARKLIRAVRRGNPDCRLLVTGCFAERDAEAVRAVGGVDLVFGNREKPGVARLFDRLGIGVAPAPASETTVAEADRGCDAAVLLPSALHFGERSRAFLKIQQGCRLSCSYCIIPKVRGPSRSVAPAEVERAARSLVRSGYREIVLTGVNTGDYGRDLEPATDLAMLLERLFAGCGPTRFRLNSLEPRTVTAPIVELFRRERRLASHLQVPLQSGSTEILRRMRRNYRREAYLERLRQLREAVPDIGLGADVIVGFPGETEERFRETYEFIAASPLNYLHVFSWSPRAGTPAAELDGRVDPAVIKRRSRALRELATDLGLAFRRRFVDRTLDAVVLGPRRDDGRLRALTGNFIEVALEENAGARPGEPLDVRIRRVTRDETTAVGCGAPGWASSRM